MFKSDADKEMKKEYVKRAEKLAEQYISVHEDELRAHARKLGLSENKIQQALEITREKSREEAKSIFIKEVERLRLEESDALNTKPTATN
jgi:hypothetical protein